MGFFSKMKRLWARPDHEAVSAEAASAKPDEPRGVPETVSPPDAATTGIAGAAPASLARADVQAEPGSGPSDGTAPWRTQLVLALREAEPRLSVWLSLILTDVDRAGPLLWERLSFLFSCLEAPAAEAEAFVTQFRAWLADMGYEAVDEFRSELQYRLALALDLEDEQDERSRLLLKLTEGLSKTKEQIARRIDGLSGSHKVMDEAFWEEFEEILIMADLGYEPTAKLMGLLRERVRKSGETDPSRFRDILREELTGIFKPQKTIRAVNPPEVVMVIGVNGVGKTTTIAKLAHRARLQGKKVLIAAGDTFRAAAIEQLKIWADRVGASFYAKGENADPAAVAYEAMDKALSEGCDIMFLDTAGRLHTKANLMEELKKIKRVLGKKHPGAPHRSVLVLDATTGQNALSQTKLFNQAVDVDEIILTKLDGTAKGGVIVGIALEYALPITFVGLGEKMEDLRPFSGQDFATALLT
ncbi:MAG: signal recognition particle-docking protein FtsY [Thermodesulfobacteriota bacterium]